jgi:hypothetical protein
MKRNDQRRHRTTGIKKPGNLPGFLMMAGTRGKRYLNLA